MTLSFQKTVITTVIIFLFFKINLFAQSANAIISATVTDVVGATKSSDMNFGIVSNESKSGIIEFNSAGVIKATRGIILLESGKPSETVSFNIIGNYIYTVSLSSSVIVLKRKGGNENMEVNLFNVEGNTVDKHNQTLYISARLKLQPSQIAGNYVPITPVNFTINYN